MIGMPGFGGVICFFKRSGLADLKACGRIGRCDHRSAARGLDHFRVAHPVRRLKKDFIPIVNQDLDDIKQWITLAPQNTTI